MTDPRAPIFAFLRPHLKGAGWNDDALREGFDRHLDMLGVPRASPSEPIPAPGGGVSGGGAGLSASGGAVAGSEGQIKGGLTLRGALEIIGHEAIVREAYKDSKGIWTWGVGVTSRSGHLVERYKDNPQSIEKCLAVFVWLLKTRYLPDVLAEFGDRVLAEHELTAALSFHYNTGAIRRASWVDLWLAGNIAAARSAFMEWKRPPEIIGRRTAERDLFFDGIWSADGKSKLYDVAKPSYSPKWSSLRRVDVRADLAKAMAA